MTTPAAAPATAPESAPPKKSRKLVLIVVCIAAIVAGAAVPMAMGGMLPFGKAKAEKPAAKGTAGKTAIVPFGEVVVNLSEERQQRYLRLKIALLVEAGAW